MGHRLRDPASLAPGGSVRPGARASPADPEASVSAARRAGPAEAADALGPTEGGLESVPCGAVLVNPPDAGAGCRGWSAAGLVRARRNGSTPSSSPANGTVPQSQRYSSPPAPPKTHEASMTPRTIASGQPRCSARPAQTPARTPASRDRVRGGRCMVPSKHGPPTPRGSGSKPQGSLRVNPDGTVSVVSVRLEA